MADNNYKELWLMYYNIVVDILRNFKNTDISDEEFRKIVRQIFKSKKLID